MLLFHFVNVEKCQSSNEAAPVAYDIDDSRLFLSENARNVFELPAISAVSPANESVDCKAICHHTLDDANPRSLMTCFKRRLCRY